MTTAGVLLAAGSGRRFAGPLPKCSLSRLTIEREIARVTSVCGVALSCPASLIG